MRKSYKNHMKLLSLFPNVLLGGIQNTEMIEITLEFHVSLAPCVFTCRVASRGLDVDFQLAIFKISVLLTKHMRNQ